MPTAAQAVVLSEVESRSRYIFSIEMPRMEQGRIVTSVIGTEYQRTGMIPDVERSGKGVGQLSIASVFRWSRCGQLAWRKEMEERCNLYCRVTSVGRNATKPYPIFLGNISGIPLTAILP